MKIKVYFLSILIASSVLISGCDSGAPRSYAEAKVSLEEQEWANPTNFLTVDGNYRNNLIGEWVLEGKINNSATVATYKDIVLTVSYYSKTDSFLGTEKQTIYEFLKAGQEHKFKIKSFGYKGTAKLSVEVSNASPNL